jgi:Tol biopolymer transport system component
MLRFARRLGAALAVVGCAASAAAPAQATFPGANGKVVFSKGGDLWTINPDGTGLAQVTSGPDTDTVPKWSPDGSAVAFERNELGFREAIQIGQQGNDIFIMRTGENPTEFGT